MPITEAEWLATERLRPMLRLVNRKAHARKLRLFACACARRVWGRVSHKVGRRAVEVAEKFAEGLATAEELSAARSALSGSRPTRRCGDAAGTSRR